MEGIRPIIADYLIRCRNWKILFFTATCSVLICFVYRLHKAAEPVTPSARAVHLQTDHKKYGKFQVEKEMLAEDISMSYFTNYPETLQNDSLYPKEFQEVNPSRDEGPAQRAKETEAMIDDVVNLIKSLSNLTDSNVIKMLTQNLNSTKLDLRDLYQKLNRFQEQEKCPACLARRPVPVTFFGTEAKIDYNEFWEGHKLPIIFSDLTNGRLGNQMGAYGTIFAIKEIFNATVLASPDSILKLRKTFPRLSLPALKEVTTDDATEWILLTDDVHSTPSFISLQLAALGLLGPQNFVLGGYPFEYQLFHAHRAKIRKEFHFHDQVIEKANNYLRSVAKTVHTETKKKRPVFVGVHVRLDDYIAHMAKVYGVEKLDYADYLQRATNYFESLYDNVVFVVASDDVEEAVKYFGFRGKQNIFFPSLPGFDADLFLRNSSSSAKKKGIDHKFIPRLPGEDMSLLSQCNHSIITLGTFGFFSAYLGSGKVLYPDIITKIPNPQTRVFFEKANLERFIPIPSKYLRVASKLR